ncbi:undecaprenyl diphosphate synthase family protein [Streptomyces sp. NPDC001508]|uniref:undecaprenyl diphosphate synthase family protein n=1 Tax=Streptomyces sp. NPDC001508 TaxID=3154656 RepID=UPI003323A2D2
MPELPDADLLIRTSGEQRISNSLPWHLAYAELVCDSAPWPDCELARLRGAVTVYVARERRFGGGSGLPSQTGRTEPVRGAERSGPAIPHRVRSPVMPSAGCTRPRR